MTQVWLLELVHGDACKSTSECVRANPTLAVCGTVVMLILLHCIKFLTVEISKENHHGLLI